MLLMLKCLVIVIGDKRCGRHDDNLIVIGGKRCGRHDDKGVVIVVNGLIASTTWLRSIESVVLGEKRDSKATLVWEDVQGHT